MDKLNKAKEDICRKIMKMTPHEFYDFCADTEYYGNPFHFDLFDCNRCREEYYCDRVNCDENCVSRFMDFMGVKENKNEVK